MEKVIRIAIVGCGGIANGKHMPSLKRLPGVEMVAFCDIIAERAEKARKDYGTPDARVYTDYKELLAKEPEVDAVHVCTPNRSHSFITIDALEAGKNVMCEKPMAKTSAEAVAMCEAAKRTGKKLTIGYQNRFRKETQYLHQLCADGELGEIYFAKAHAVRRRAVPNWGVFLNEEEQGGGPLIDIGTHALDLTLWMMNNYKPLYVVGNAYHKLADTKDAANAFGPWDPEKFTVEDSAFGFITMENGATISLESSWALNIRDVGEARTTLCGTKAGADMRDGLTINGKERSRLYEKKIELNMGGVAFYDSTDSDLDNDCEAAYWINCLRTDGEVLVKPEEALVVTRILEAIYESSKTKKPVYLG